jgi:hypothetical protein
MWRQQTGYHPPIEKELEDIEVNGEII